MSAKLLFRQLFDAQSSTFTYLLGDSASGDALLVDPVLEQTRRDLALAHELKLRIVATVDTHVHADHVTAAAAIRHRVASRISVSRASGARGADTLLEDGDRIPFGSRYLVAHATPGHTAGCMTLVLDDRSRAFTGDCLLIRATGRTDFQGGNAAQLYRSVHEQIFSLPAQCRLYPAHDYRGFSVTTVGEERSFNLRLGGELSESDFVGYMDNLGLPHPKMIKEAVPANLLCGSGAVAAERASEPAWGEVSYSFAGIWEVDGAWLEENLAKVQVIDVREPDEYTGPLGHIAPSILIPLGTLAARAGELDRSRPIVTVCRAGGRSAQASVILQRAGLKDVASLAGGMLRWRSRGYATDGGETG